MKTGLLPKKTDVFRDDILQNVWKAFSWPWNQDWDGVRDFQVLQWLRAQSHTVDNSSTPTEHAHSDVRFVFVSVLNFFVCFILTWNHGDIRHFLTGSRPHSRTDAWFLVFGTRILLSNHTEQATSFWQPEGGGSGGWFIFLIKPIHPVSRENRLEISPELDVGK